jgi:thymidine kinase
MAKLYFRHGAVGSAKTLNLLAVAHSYEEQGKRICLIKPSLDNRFGVEIVKSRVGLNRVADVLVDENTQLADSLFEGIHCVLVDEVQFIAPRVIEQLRHVASGLNVPVIAYGLKSDFRSHLFPGSKRMLELCDKIEEVKSTCKFCNAKACLSLRTVDGRGTVEGAVISLGCEELYVPVCYAHFYQKTQGSEEVCGLKDALQIGAAIEKAIAPCKVEDDDLAEPPRTTREPDQELTPEKA